MSLYVDRFCGNLKNLSGKLDYFGELGVNFLHLMPMFESPEGESDGGYAVSDFRKVDQPLWYARGPEEIAGADAWMRRCT